ncbi:hypothetical protein NJT12_19155 [Flavobacterium sp. AC]|uniref:WG repeat-containing protein n=1 Tax=Flavobacterium azizsancarii TaxID=2961580 RepID=A0ABT4WGN2_9FLAO|nr:hypothetical protein [Flavobacterium azizsancarii]MDA6071748.1 hypothetical protein [Flavobacterium azizsancarii]
MLKTIYMFFLFVLPLISFSQSSKIEDLKKDYNLEIKKGGFILLKDKKSADNIKIANAAGEIIYSFKGDNKKGFLSGLNCGKFFTSKVRGSGNDGGGYMIFEYVDVEIHDVKNPEVGIKTNFNFTNGSWNQPFEVYSFFDNTEKVGIVNSCGEIIVPAQYNSIGNFNKSGQALAFTNTDFTVLDTLGKSLLKQPFKHARGQVFKYDYDVFVKDNRVRSSLDGKQFGIYDFKENKQLIPNNYDKIYSLDKMYYHVKGEKKDVAYLAQKNDIIELIDYSNLKNIFPISVGANDVSSLLEFKDKYMVIFSKTRKIIKQLGANSSRDESMYLKNIYYDGKVLFDPKLEIKEIKIYKDRFFTLQLYNGGSKIYDFEKSKFIADFPNDLIAVSDYRTFSHVISNEQYVYNGQDGFFNVSIPCKGANCQTSSSSKGAICDYNGRLRTDFLQDVSYTVLKPDTTQDKFLFLTYSRPDGFMMNYDLYDNDGKLKLEHFEISDNQKEYSLIVKNNILVLNEKIEKTAVYGKTAFDVDGKMIGERYMFISDPSKKEEVKSNYTKEQLESQKNNRFLKK